VTALAARLARPIQRLGSVSLIGIVLAALLAVAGSLMLMRAVALRDAVLPGVHVAGVDVGGLSRVEAEARVGRAIAERLAAPVEVRVGNKALTAEPGEIFALDRTATGAAAFGAARDSIGSRLAALAVPFVVESDVDPVLRLQPDGREAFSAQLLELVRRPVNARIEMAGREPAVVPGRDGTAVDEAALLEALQLAALTGASSIEAELASVEPALTTAEAERAANVARIVVAAPVGIKFKREQIAELTPRRLAALVRFQPVAGAYEVTIDREALARQLGPAVEPFTRKPVDASFDVDGKRVRVVRAKLGTTLAFEEAGEAVLAAATKPGTRVAKVGLARLAPEFTTRDARALGIREQVSTYTTDMGVSSANRIWNVQLLGRYLDGTILKPGQWFSYNKVMGPRTVERGFREGQMIFGGVLIPSIGGGVCQTGTTIFNAAFEAGLPIRERHNHSFYISHYPVGRDATVSWGGPDLVFKNDLDHAILIKAHGSSETFTVTFYGTKQKRKVVSSTSAPTNYTQPKLQYAIDPSAPRNSVRTASGGGPGFDVNVHRKVYEDGKLIREDDFFTRYTPQNPTAIYGPGRTPPGPYFYLPASG
jgi:vancomycin resistance protein YoaR